jgi:hypothetical protein
LDPSIRVTYHPRSKVTSKSGIFYGKTKTYAFSQRITVVNTKSIAIDSPQLKILDQVPVSQDAQITVKLINPPLTRPSTSGIAMGAGTDAPVNVSDGVMAQWEGADEPDGDVNALGKEGMLCWVCGVVPQGKINLLLQWEVSVPIDTDKEIVGCSVRLALSARDSVWVEVEV